MYTTLKCVIEMIETNCPLFNQVESKYLIKSGDPQKHGQSCTISLHWIYSQNVFSKRKHEIS